MKWSPIEKPQGIGGWLILFAIGQVVGPLKFIASTLHYYDGVDAAQLEKFPITFIGEGVMNFTLFVLITCTSVAFFGKSRWFPRLFIWEVIATMLFFPISALWAAATIGMVTGQSMGEHLKDMV